MIKLIHVVEDDQDIRQVIGFILEEEGYKVKLFPDVTSFHATMAKTVPDLYLLDVMLPDGNGIELCKEIRTTQMIKDIPIIVMSANTQPANVFKQCLADDFISKPFDLSDILGKINRQISLH